MERNGKKIFGIGAVVLMILVTILPTINAMQKELTEDQGNETTLGGYDLEVRIDNIESTSEKKINDKEIEITYKISYTVENVGDVLYIGKPVTYLRHEHSSKWIAWWEETLYTLSKGKSKSFSHELKVISSAEADANPSPGVIYESDLLSGTILLETGKVDDAGIDDINLLNNIGQALAKHWKDTKEYVPTMTQVAASGPCGIIKKPVENFEELYIIEMRDVRLLPSILRSNRMGWVKEASEYLLLIAADISAIIISTYVFVKSIEGDALLIINWINKLAIWFGMSVEGAISFTGLVELIDEFFTVVIPAVSRIAAKATAYAAELAVLANQLLKHLDDFYYWRLNEPWTKEIKIEGTVGKVMTGEKITVTCRKISKTYYDEDDGVKDGVVHYSFNVTSDPQNDPNGKEKAYYNLHNCQITVTGGDTKHSKEVLQTPPIYSYAYSKGLLSWDLSFKIGGGKEKSTNILTLRQFILEILTGQKLFKNILSSSFLF